ncbi:DNA-binding protein HU-beta [Yoonia tamlensis]|uniref:DNA-binding protein HU-beta n=1 Tax=Yoonia tamlensis TaxID=390270 RepID=A0A1I6G447_9RHOB|nr:HU family DNA-binding protein [Yoonia tamlensis]SFR36974.1 DNA-binding protein HU-beta [Yoonia tamlensis]
MTNLDTPATDDVNATPVLKKPQLFNEVVARTGLKKRDVKPAVEAALAVIGEALARGEELILPPMGKTRIVKSKELGNGAALLTLKFRTAKVHAPAQGTADTDEDA